MVIDIINTNEFISFMKQLIICNSNNDNIYIPRLSFDRLLLENERNIIWQELISDKYLNNNQLEYSYMFFVYENNTKSVCQIHVRKTISNLVQLTFFAINNYKYKSYE